MVSFHRDAAAFDSSELAASSVVEMGCTMFGWHVQDVILAVQAIGGGGGEDSGSWDAVIRL